MKHFTCKICGGDIQLPDNVISAKCPYCQTTITLNAPPAEPQTTSETTSDSDGIEGCFGVVAIIVVGGLILYALYKLFIECDCFFCRMFR